MWQTTLNKQKQDLGDTDKQKLQIILKNYTESQKMINTLKSQLDQQQQQHKHEVQQLKEELRELSQMSRVSRASSQRTTQIKRPQGKQNVQNHTNQPAPKHIKPAQKHTTQNKQASSQLAQSNTFALSNDPVRNLRILQNQVANTFQNIQNGMSSQVSQLSSIQQGNNIPNISADQMFSHIPSYQTQHTNNGNIPGDVAFGSGSPVSQYLQTDTIRQLSGQGNIVDIINQSLPKFDSESFICNQNNNYMTQQEMDQRINDIIQQQQEIQQKDPPYMSLLKSKQEFNMRMQQKFQQVQSPTYQHQTDVQTEQVYTQLNTAQLNNKDEKEEANFARTAINLTGAQHDTQQQNALSEVPSQGQQHQQSLHSNNYIVNNVSNHEASVGHTNSVLPVVSALDDQPKKNDSNFVQLNHKISQPKVISVLRTHTPPPEDNVPVSSAKLTTQQVSEFKRKQMEKSATMMEERSDDLPINSAILGKNYVTANTSGVTTSRVSNQSMHSQLSQHQVKKPQSSDLEIDRDFYNEYKLKQQEKEQKQTQNSQQIQSQYQQLFSKNQNESVRPTSSVNRTRSSDYPRVDLSQNNYYNTKDQRFDSYENQETFPASATTEPVNDLIDKRLIDSQRLKVSEARLFDSQRVKMDENLKIYDKQAQSIRKTIGCLDEDEYESIIQLLQSSYGG